MSTEAQSWYSLGKSNLLSGKFYESLNDYAKGIQLTSNEELIKTAQKHLSRINQSRNLLPGYQWVQKLLQIGIAAKFPSANDGKVAFKQIRELSPIVKEPIKSPVVILAGGCSVEFESQMTIYNRVITEAFRDFTGTIISGGTTSGISGLIGRVQQKYPDKIHTIGYVPKIKTELVDKRYREIRLTEGEEFSPAEPLQYWIDLIASSIEPSAVKLLGINGGRISAIEYRISLALGAQVAVVEESGLEADKLLTDTDWNKSPNLYILSNNPQGIRPFVMM
jgi:hypothetical protein